MGTQETIEILCEVNRLLMDMVKQQSDLLILHDIDSTMDESCDIADEFDYRERIRELM